MGYSQNEPVNIAVMSAIDAAYDLLQRYEAWMRSLGDPNALQIHQMLLLVILKRAPTYYKQPEC